MELPKNNTALAMLWVTAAIWGFAFVAQRSAMQSIGPFTFNGLRFALGSASLLPLLILQRNKQGVIRTDFRKLLKGGILAGLVLFGGASLQQVGMVGTSAGKAGFITGLYIVIVPLIGLFIRQKTSQALWTGSLLALAGLFLLTINRNFAIEKGDFFILLSAFFWAAHVQLINKLVKSLPPLKLSIIQFLVCSVLSILTASCYESMEISGLRQAIIPLLYGGIASVGVAYTLQVFAQQHVHPAYAALILSFEMVFAALGGWLILHETLTIQNLAGCVLMLSGVVVVQTPLLKKRKE